MSIDIFVCREGFVLLAATTCAIGAEDSSNVTFHGRFPVDIVHAIPVCDVSKLSYIAWVRGHHDSIALMNSVIRPMQG